MADNTVTTITWLKPLAGFICILVLFPTAMTWLVACLNGGNTMENFISYMQQVWKWVLAIVGIGGSILGTIWFFGGFD